MSEGATTQCVVLVGGLGTRLGHLTKETPKPLLEVGGRPFLETILWHVMRLGFSKVVLLASFEAQKVVDFGSRTRFASHLEIKVVVEDVPAGTGGALKHAAHELDETFLLLNGDSIFDFNWLDLIPRLKEVDAIGAMSLRRVDDASRFGVAMLRADRVVGFRERGDAGGGLVNGGVYLMRRSILDHLSDHCSLEREILPALAARGSIIGHQYDGFFTDIGLPSSFSDAEGMVPASMSRPALFLDRDGVVNVDYGYVGTVARFEWMPTAVEAIKHANDLGWFVFLVTNQAGVARGYYSETEVRALGAHIQSNLRRRGAHIDDIRYCPFHPEGTIEAYAVDSDWRKPRPGMILDILNNWPVDQLRSVLIGDQLTDLMAARAANITPYLFDGSRTLLDLVSDVIGSSQPSFPA